MVDHPVRCGPWSGYFQIRLSTYFFKTSLSLLIARCISGPDGDPQCRTTIDAYLSVKVLSPFHETLTFLPLDAFNTSPHCLTLHLNGNWMSGSAAACWGFLYNLSYRLRVLPFIEGSTIRELGAAISALQSPWLACALCFSESLPKGKFSLAVYLP